MQENTAVQFSIIICRKITANRKSCILQIEKRKDKELRSKGKIILSTTIRERERAQPQSRGEREGLLAKQEKKLQKLVSKEILVRRVVNQTERETELDCRT